LLRLSLSLEEAHQKLQHALTVEKNLKTTQTTVFWVPVTTLKAKIAIYGTTNPDTKTFELWVERMNWRNSFKPILTGKFDVKHGKTQVLFKFRMDTFVRVFMTIWFIGFGGSMIAGMIHTQNVFYGVFPFVLGTSIFYSGKHAGSKDKIELERFLEKTFVDDIKGV
jgi:hypothetical protein